MNLPNFWYGSCSYNLLWGSLTLNALKISDFVRNFGHLSQKVGHFCQNCLFWVFLTYNFQTQPWIFLIFGMELLWILTLSGEQIILCLVFGIEVGFIVLFQKIYMLGKFWYGEICPFKAIFGQNWQFLEFLAYNFQTRLWIFLIWFPGCL